MIQILLSWVILAGAVMLTTILLRPWIRIKSWKTAFAVAAVFGVLNVLLFKLMVVLSLPAIVLTLGLFTFVLHAALLWITDQIIDDFEIKSFGWTVLAAVLITVLDRCGHYVIR